MSKIQKENLFFFLFSNASNFGKAKVTKKREKKQKENLFFFVFIFPTNVADDRWFRVHVTSAKAKITKNREQNKRNFSFLCRDEVISRCFQAKLLKRLEIKDERSEFFAIFGAMY